MSCLQFAVEPAEFSYNAGVRPCKGHCEGQDVDFRSTGPLQGARRGRYRRAGRIDVVDQKHPPAEEFRLAL